MKLISFRGFALNADGLTTAFDRSMQRPSANPIAVRRQGRRPKVTGVEYDPWTLPDLGMLIDGELDDGEVEALRLAILKAFDTRSGPGALIVADNDGGNERYLYVVCQDLTQVKGQSGDGFVATLVADDDTFWQGITPATAAVTMDDFQKSFTATNGGHVDTFPVVDIAPSVSISGISYWRYRQFVAVPWTSPTGASGWTVELTDNSGFNTATLVSGGKADTADTLTVFVDGTEVDRWYGAGDGVAHGFNSSNTWIWANLDFRAGLAATLVSDDGDEIEVAEDISAWPESGILRVNSEIMTYTGRDLYRRVFTGVTGAAHGSTAGSHTVGDVVEWIQHEIWIAYSPSMTARPTNDSLKPIINLGSSTNAAWVWNEFGSATEPNRAAQWTPLAGGIGRTFTGNEDGAATDPYQVAGMSLAQAGAGLASNYSRWYIYLPCGIAAYDIDGSDYAGSLTDIFLSPDGANWTLDNLSPGSGSGWVDWNESNSGISAAMRYLAVAPRASIGDGLSQMETVEITMQGGLYPAPVFYPEQNNYQLLMRIDNLTTGEWIEVALLPGLKQGADGVVIDTGAKTAIFDTTGVNVYHAIRRNTLRPDILKLRPGVNQMRVTENPPAGNVVSLSWTERWYL